MPCVLLEISGMTAPATAKTMDAARSPREAKRFTFLSRRYQSMVSTVRASAQVASWSSARAWSFHFSTVMSGRVTGEMSPRSQRLRRGEPPGIAAGMTVLPLLFAGLRMFGRTGLTAIKIIIVPGENPGVTILHVSATQFGRYHRFDPAGSLAGTLAAAAGP